VLAIFVWIQYVFADVKPVRAARVEKQMREEKRGEKGTQLIVSVLGGEKGTQLIVSVLAFPAFSACDAVGVEPQTGLPNPDCRTEFRK